MRGGFADITEGVKRAFRDRQQLELIDFDDLAVAIEAAVAAYTVGKLHFAALRAHGTGGRRNLVVGAATGMGAGTAHFALRYCHLDYSFYSWNDGCRSQLLL